VNKRYYNNDSTVISRLADQAHETSCLIYDKRLKKERADAVIFYDIFNQKFAELIVKECVRYFNEDYQRDFDTLWREDLTKGIKEHFGVKE
jgi:hypothetical protein